MVTRCPFDPQTLAGEPIGMLHCPSCGCMVLAGLPHGPCVNRECDYYDADVDAEMDRQFAAEYIAERDRLFALLAECPRCSRVHSAIGDEVLFGILSRVASVLQERALHRYFHHIWVSSLRSTPVRALENGRVEEVLAWSRTLTDPSFT